MKDITFTSYRSKITRIITKNLCTLYLLLFILLFVLPYNAIAVPEIVSLRITDVTPCSFSIVWMTDVASDPTVEVYSDSLMKNQITNLVRITPMAGASKDVADSARQKGIMKVRVSGLDAATRYYVRAVTRDPLTPTSVGYSPLHEAITASRVMPYHYTGNTVQDFSNDLTTFRVYIRPSDMGTGPGLGDLVVLEASGSPYLISAFVGNGINTPDGVLDLNNLFDGNGVSLDITGGERIVITVFRGGTLSTLTHYRRVPVDGKMVYVAEPLTGFFADINLDTKIDDEDFVEFRKQYKTLPNDASYNPDFNFVEDPEGRVDVREFSKFSKEYGRTDVK